MTNPLLRRFGPVELTVEDGVATLVLDDPQHRNALSLEMTRGIAAAVRSALEGRSCRALVVASTPPVFCAGGSVDDLLEPRAPLEEMYVGFEVIAEAPVPTIAAVDGPVLGAGLNVALACDVMICTPEARFEVRFLALGLHPGGGTLWRLRERIGQQGAAALALFGDGLSGSSAEECGLAWRCVAKADLMAEAHQMARMAADLNPEVVAESKKTLQMSATARTSAEAVALELEPQRLSMGRSAFQDNLRALRRRLGKEAAPSVRR